MESCRLPYWNPYSGDGNARIITSHSRDIFRMSHQRSSVYSKWFRNDSEKTDQDKFTPTPFPFSRLSCGGYMIASHFECVYIGVAQSTLQITFVCNPAASTHDCDPCLTYRELDSWTMLRITCHDHGALNHNGGYHVSCRYIRNRSWSLVFFYFF